MSTPTHTTLQALLDQYNGWAANPESLGCNSCGSSDVTADDQALTLLHQFAAAAGVLDVRPGNVVDELAAQLRNEWPGGGHDFLDQAVVRTMLRLLVGVELPLQDDEKPAEPEQWATVIRAARYGVPGFADVPLCRWVRDAEGLWRSEHTESLGGAAVARYQDLSHIEVLQRGPE